MNRKLWKVVNWLVAWPVILAICVGCNSLRAHCGAGSPTNFPHDWYTNDFAAYQNSAGMEVLVTPRKFKSDMSRHPVLLLHELPGMTPQCLQLATNLSSAGFTVYVPLMFGKPNESASFRNWAYLSISPKWHIYRKARTSPIVKNLRELVQEIDETDGTNSIGVIGMCLTGSLPLALLTEPSVRAVVLSQPATPLIELTEKQKAALGLSREDLLNAKSRVIKEQIPILGLRFCTDKICQAPRFATLHCEFGTNFVDLTIPGSEYDGYLLAGEKEGHEPHSVLCEDYSNAAGSATRVRFERVVAYFKERLR